MPTSLLAVLIGASTLAPLSNQIFLPALPVVQRAFAVPPGAAQLNLSLFMLAMAVATLAFGPPSDRIGRRPALLLGLVVFMVGSLVCLLAPTNGALVAGRVVQAAGGVAGFVLARTIVRDLMAREQAAATIAYLTMGMVVAPMLGPVIGALIVDLVHWRAVFAVLLAAGAGATVVVALRLRETAPDRGVAAGRGGMLRDVAHLLRSPTFCGYTFQGAFAMTTFFAFLAGAPYHMVDTLGRPPTEFGLYFVLVAASFMAGNFTAGRITVRVGLNRMIVLGVSLGIVGVAIVALLAFAGVWTPLALFAPMALTAFGNGLALPSSQTGAISVDPQVAGTASGLAGFLQMTLASLAAQAVGMLQDGTPHAMAAFMLVASLLSLAAFGLVLRRPAEA